MKESNSLPPELLQGIEEFNRHDFFQCHETLEELWRTQKEPDRQFTQGLIQIAVGYYHQRRDNRAGALKLLKRGLDRIKNFQPQYKGINVDKLVRAVESDLSDLERAGETGAPEPFAPRIDLLSTLKRYALPRH